MRGAAAAVLVVLTFAGCGGGSPPTATLAAPEPTTTATSTPVMAVPPSTTTPLATTPPATTPPTVVGALPDPKLGDAGAVARQAIVVTTDGYGVNTATFTVYQREGSTWRAVMGPWPARIGNQGFAPPGQKREGDGRTPSGAYGFGFFFGVAPDPGVRFEYRQVPDDTIIWDEEPTSPTYNLWVDLDDRGGGRDPEGMYQPVAYQHGAVIAYNAARVPGLGSGIFLHATTGRATAGCVSLPVGQLVSVLRWLDPAQQPRIILGVASA